jgi:hypothetical protein
MIKCPCPALSLAVATSVTWAAGAGAEEPGAIVAEGRDDLERFAIVVGVHGTPLVAVLDGSRDSAYYSTLHAPFFYGAGAAFRCVFAQRFAMEGGARYEALTTAQGERRAIEQGVNLHVRGAVLLAGSSEHGLELIPELSYQYVWTDRRDDLQLSGAGVQVALGYRLGLAEKIRLRVELGGRWDGGGFRNGEGNVAEGGRSRLSIPLTLAVEYGL